MLMSYTPPPGHGPPLLSGATPSRSGSALSQVGDALKSKPVQQAASLFHDIIFLSLLWGAWKMLDEKRGG